jgi:hypothetical protein
MLYGWLANQIQKYSHAKLELMGVKRYPSEEADVSSVAEEAATT